MKSVYVQAVTWLVHQFIKINCDIYRLLQCALFSFFFDFNYPDLFQICLINELTAYLRPEHSYKASGSLRLVFYDYFESELPFLNLIIYFICCCIYWLKRLRLP